MTTCDIWVECGVTYGENGVSEREQQKESSVRYGKNGMCDTWRKWGEREKDKNMISVRYGENGVRHIGKMGSSERKTIKDLGEIYEERVFDILENNLR